MKISRSQKCYVFALVFSSFMPVPVIFGAHYDGYLLDRKSVDGNNIIYFGIDKNKQPFKLVLNPYLLTHPKDSETASQDPAKLERWLDTSMSQHLWLRLRYSVSGRNSGTICGIESPEPIERMEQPPTINVNPTISPTINPTISPSVSLDEGHKAVRSANPDQRFNSKPTEGKRDKESTPLQYALHFISQLRLVYVALVALILLVVASIRKLFAKRHRATREVKTKLQTAKVQRPRSLPFQTTPGPICNASLKPKSSPAKRNKKEAVTA